MHPRYPWFRWDSLVLHLHSLVMACCFPALSLLSGSQCAHGVLARNLFEFDVHYGLFLCQRGGRSFRCLLVICCRIAGWLQPCSFAHDTV